jgi:glycogen operon protein
MDFTGCGNTVNSSNPHVVQLIMDSLRYWVTEMHVDGFRFDLATALARSDHGVDMFGTFMTTIQQDPVLRSVKLIAEPWDVGPGGYQVGEFPPLWTEWNDKYRDCLRDFWRGAAGIGELGWRLSGSADLYASEGRRPYASVNFITAHDGFTMRDLVTYERKHNEANGEQNRDGTDNNRSRNYGIEGETSDKQINSLRRRQLRNMLTSMLLSTGVPMITAGDEFGRTQDGNNNAYCQDNEISWLNWKLKSWQKEQLEFTRAILRIRSEHPAFRQRYFFDGRPMHEGGPKDLAWIAPDGSEVKEDAWHDSGSHTLGMFVAGDVKTHDDKQIHDDSFLLIVHAGAETTEFTLPGALYGSSFRRIVDTYEPARGDSTEFAAGDVLTVEPYSSVLLQISR